MNRFVKMTSLAAGLACVLALGACSVAPDSMTCRNDLDKEGAVSLYRAQGRDPLASNVFNTSAGYAVFPTVGKGAVGIGGAHGRGVLIQGGMVVGYCEMCQATLGVQLGGQAYTEILCFETPQAIANFKAGNFRFASQASAVVLNSGAGTNAKFADGVKVFTMDESGLMLETALGGQKFGYQAK